MTVDVWSWVLAVAVTVTVKPWARSTSAARAASPLTVVPL
jgi:hypothetical protein